MLQIKGNGEYKADHVECYSAYAEGVSDAFDGHVISSGGAGPAPRGAMYVSVLPEDYLHDAAAWGVQW